MKIATIIGARPQFIKAAAVSRAIAAYNEKGAKPFIHEVIIHTGQHYDNGMSAVFFQELGIPDPDYHLNVGSGSHGIQTGQMLVKIEEVLLKEAPGWVLVYGDTNSTLAGALAAAKLHFRIAHVEAGLRSFNRLMPEEVNRVVTDHLSDLLLCPSQTAVNNLTTEGITRGVEIVGDVMADALQFATTRSALHSDVLERLNLSEKSFLLATIHRPENTDHMERLENILSAFKALKQQIVFPVHPRTKKIIEEKMRGSTLWEVKNSPFFSKCCETQSLFLEHVKFIDPVGYFDMIALEQSARMILTDSGGMQKEAYWLKVPCITLRDETEWVETIEAGWNVLTGAETLKIIDAVRNFQLPADHPPLFGDGNSAVQCISAIIKATEK